MLAVTGGRENIVKELLSFGADASKTDPHGQVASDYCMFTQSSTRKLLEESASWKPTSMGRVFMFALLLSLSTLFWTKDYSVDKILLHYLRSAVSLTPLVWIASRHFQFGHLKNVYFKWLSVFVYLVMRDLSAQSTLQYGHAVIDGFDY